MAEQSTERLTIAIEGVTNEAAPRVESALMRVPGVHRVFVSAATEMAYVECGATGTAHSDMLQAVESLGLHADDLTVRSRSEPALSQDRPPETRTPGALPTRPLRAPSATGLHRSDTLPASASRDGRAYIVRASHIVSGAGIPSIPGHRPHLLLLVLALGAALAPLLWWMGSAMQPGDQVRYTLEMGARGFRPVAVVIPAGEPATLRVSNSDPGSSAGGSRVIHQFAVRELGIDVRLGPGQSELITLPPMQPATYHFYCGICCGSTGAGGASGTNDPSMQGALIIH